MICKKCNEDKDVSLFCKDRSRPSGYHPYCTSCKSRQNIRREKILADEKFNGMLESKHRMCHVCKLVKHELDFNKRSFIRRLGVVSCLECENKAKELRKIKNKEYSTIYRRNSTNYTKNKVLLSQRRVECKTTLLSLLGNKCSRCGIENSEQYPPCCFDFHHIDPSTKEFNIGHVLNTSDKDFDKLVIEVRKCILLCSNCHRIIHTLDGV